MYNINETYKFMNLTEIGSLSNPTYLEISSNTNTSVPSSIKKTPSAYQRSDSPPASVSLTFVDHGFIKNLRQIQSMNTHYKL